MARKNNKFFAYHQTNSNTINETQTICLANVNNVFRNHKLRVYDYQNTLINKKIKLLLFVFIHQRGLNKRHSKTIKSNKMVNYYKNYLPFCLNI